MRKGEKLMLIVNDIQPVRPRVQNIDKFSNTKLLQIIKNDKSSSVSVQCLTELLYRTLDQNRELIEKIELLEQELSTLQATLNPPKKKSGRKAQAFFINGKILDDEYLVYLIDNEFYKIRELEREVGAGKNQLRRRYERYKEKRRKEG